jgi:hypothetical protein
MKHVLVTLLAAAALSTSAFAADHRIEIGFIVSKTGVKISCVYDLPWKGQVSTVHMIFPNGSDVQVDFEAGTSQWVMDKALHQIADERTAPK